jgi:hypothetical protein
MNTKNFEFLKDGLKYMGFGDKLNSELETRINEQPTEFKLSMQGEYKKDSGVERVDYTLDFRKSDQTDMYFFNRYQATLRNEEDPTKEKSQTFYVTKNSGITAKEAYNLLSGRSVNKDLTNKEGQPFNAWLKMDFTEKDKNDNFKVKQFTSGYGYELDKVLDKFPVKELADAEQKEKLMKSLEKGNLTSVTFQKDGKEDKMFIEANPQFKTLTVYDASMKKMYQENEKKGEKQEPDKTPEKKQTVKKGTNEEEEDSTTQKKRPKRKGVGV